MLELNLKEIVSVIGGDIVAKSNIPSNSYTGATIDTRILKDGNIFFALKGASFNGNEHIQKAFEMGAKLCIVDELHLKDVVVPNDCDILLVDNVEVSLGEIAKYYIEKLNVKVIGVTGSVGKTSTKDILCASLGEDYKVLKTLGNYNNGIGLPLTILRLDSTYDIAVLEMGMSNAKEIEYLANIARPHIVVITNIGLSHIENLGSQENILKAKMEATTFFENNSVLVLNGDDKMLNTINDKEYKVIKVGTSEKFDIYSNNIKLLPSSSNFNLHCKDLAVSLNLNMPGHHNIINYMLAVAVAEEIGVSIDNVSSGIKKIEKTSMRLDVSEINNVTYINDCYNASPDSMRAAIEVQVNMKRGRNIAVLGSMYELGDCTQSEHKKLGEYIKSKNIDTVFATGEFTNFYKESLGDKCYLFDNKTELISELKKYVRNGDSVLIKASRGAKFEEIYNAMLA